jgi:glycosyltransferase involved in cell wall biosynthesis
VFILKRILYIDIKFPLLTGTFVYREIEALRDAGYEITTVSMATPIKSHISAEALHFLDTTIYLDQAGLLRMFYAQLIICFKDPSTWIRLLLAAIREKEIKKFRDRIRILYHFILSGYLSLKLKNRSFDHIHSPFLTGSATIAFFLSQYLTIPFSFTMHASNIYVDPLMLATKLHNCKNAVTISKYNKAFLLHKYGVHLDHKIHIIHCGVNVEVFRPAQKKKPMPPIILAVGQLMERKGFIYLLKASSLLKKKHLIFRCLIVGDGEDKESLIKHSESLGVCDVVTFMGRQPQEEVKKLLEDASVFTLPSIVTDEGGREGIPVALMEAMAMELPVVSTRTVGIPELIEYKVEGLLVEQKNPEDLAHALEILLLNKELRSEMGRAARKKIIREFNIANTPIQFKELLI